MYDTPIWYLESRLFDAWEWLTGKDRLALRTIVLAISLITAALGRFNQPAGMAIFSILIGMRWFNWPYSHEVEYRVDIIRLATALIFYWNLYDLTADLWIGTFAVFREIGWLLLWLSDYILWANHMNRPRKRRKPLPEHVKELLSTLDWLPKPVPER